MARLFVVALLGLALAGCELVADFDRDKIPGPDAGRTTDAGTTPRPGTDAAVDDEDGGSEDSDAAVDAGTDAGADAGVDGTDAGIDAGIDAGADASVDAGANADDDAG